MVVFVFDLSFCNYSNSNTEGKRASLIHLKMGQKLVMLVSIRFAVMIKAYVLEQVENIAPTVSAYLGRL
jgi:hypothetical protein